MQCCYLCLSDDCGAVRFLLAFSMNEDLDVCGKKVMR